MARRRRKPAPYKCGECSRWRCDTVDPKYGRHLLGCIKHEDGSMEQIGHCDRFDVTRTERHEACPDFDAEAGTQQRLV